MKNDATHWQNRADFLLNESVTEGGMKELFEGSELTQDFKAICDRPLSPHKVDKLMGLTAVLAENSLKYNAQANGIKYKSKNLFETRAEQVSGFQDHLFPSLRAAIPQNPILDWVSVQPMTRKTGQVFFRNIQYGSNKGRIALGGRVFDVLRGFAGGYNFTSEFVEDELLGTGTGSAVTFAKTLDYSPTASSTSGGIRPGTVAIKWTQSDGVTAAIARDNGNGGLVLEVGSEALATDAPSYINYGSGSVSIKFGTAPANGTPVYVSYEYDSEGTDNIPTIDLDIQALPVIAQRRALKVKFTQDSAMDLKAETGQDLEELQVQHAVGLLVAEQARQVIDDLWQCSGSPAATFNTNFTANPYQTARAQAADFSAAIATACNLMLRETQRFQPNFALVDTNAKNLLDIIGPPHFAAWQQAPASSEAGVQFVGVWNNQIRIYCDPLLDQQPGASPYGNILLGHKSADDLEAGYIYAPYVPLYSSPSIQLDDMVTRRAFASRIGRRTINPRLYKRVELVKA